MPSPGETDLTIEELQAKLQESEAQRTALERAKLGLQADLVKRKSIEKIAKAAGIDLAADDADDRIAELLGSRQIENRAASTVTPPAQPPAAPSDAAQVSAAQTPSSAVDEALRAKLTSMETQLLRMEEEVKKERREKEQERKARQEEYKKSVVMQELDKAGCKRSAHVYVLRGKEFRILDDGETIVFGPEENPINVSDAISNIEQDDEYSIYFPGTVPSGSGLPSSRSSLPVADNPFTKSGSNATRAAEIIARDRPLAKRLAQQARARGDLDPLLGKHVL